MAKKTIALLVLVAMLFNLLQISVFANEVDAVKEFNDKGTHTLNEDVTANGCDGAIYVNNGTKLTINGGNIHGVRCDGKKCSNEDCTFSMALWAYGSGTEVTITDGYFTNDSDGSDHCDLIYVKNGAYIYIKGGTFECATPAWTLNAKDNSPGQIIVSGGRFFEFNPADNIVSAQGNQDIVVADGYTVVKTFDAEKNGYWYEVQPISNIKEFTSANGAVVLNEDVKANGCDGAIYAHDGANVTINGGSIHGQVCAEHDYSMALWARGAGTEVTITDGYFTNDSDGSDHCDLIYVKDGAYIYIKGGEFKCATPAWTLNAKDNAPGQIIVSGGRFYKFNPEDNIVSAQGNNDVVVAEGYKVVQDGDWFEVVCAHLECEEHAKKDATYTEEGMKAYWTCKLCSKMFEDKDAKVEVTDEKSLVIPKLVQVVAGNAFVSGTAFNNAVAEAGKTGSSVVVIPVTKTEETVSSVTVPVSSLEEVIDEEKELSIETSEGIITIDVTTMEEIAKQAENASNVKIEVIKVGESVLNDSQKEAIKDKEVAAVISAQIIADGKVISDFGGGKVTVEIPFTPAEDAKGEDYVVIYIADDGKVTEIPTKYENGKIIVELEHFSEYAIVKDFEVKEDSTTGSSDGVSVPGEPAPSDTTANSNIVKTGDNIVLYISILVISVLGAAIIVSKKFNIKK